MGCICVSVSYFINSHTMSNLSSLLCLIQWSVVSDLWCSPYNRLGMPQTAPTKDPNFTNVMCVPTVPGSAVPQLLFPFLRPHPLRLGTEISPVNNSWLASQCSNKRYCLFLYFKGERWSSLHEEDRSVEAVQGWASCSKHPCWESKGRVLGGHFKRYSSESIVLSKKKSPLLWQGKW